MPPNSLANQSISLTQSTPATSTHQSALPARKLPGSLEANPRLGHWLRLEPNGVVVITPGKVEIGQGILTALVQIVAEALDVSPARIRLLPASTGHSPDEGVTSGSRSIQESGLALRHVATEVRDLFLDLAAARLDVSIEQLIVDDGLIRASNGTEVSYWDLYSPELFAREASLEVVSKRPADFTVVGTSLARIDLQAKVTGQAVYVQDLQLPDMVHGRISRPPGPGACLIAIDVSSVERMPGVLAVVRLGRFLGVVAAREEQAIRAERRLAGLAQWAAGPELPSSDPRELLQWPAETEVISERGALGAVEMSGAQQLRAEYTKPYLAHAALAPSCAVAQFSGEQLQVWTHSQGIYPLRGDLAATLGMAPSDIVVTHMEAAGCYGHNGADDVALDAALLARAVPGRAVRVQWMREDEFGWEPLSSPMVVQLAARIDEAGIIVDWDYALWSHAHSTRPGGRGGVNLLAAWHLEPPLPAAIPGNPPLPAGGSHRNAIPLYDFPNQRITNHLIRRSPVRTSSLRALGGHANVFAIECFMDELAHASGADPVAYRLRHLKDMRARAVIERVAAMANWQPHVGSDGECGRGIGFARYKNLAAYMAVVAAVRVAETVQVTHVWAAVDVGQVINPDGLKNQIEGGIVQTVSWTLKECVQFDRQGVSTRNWETYPILQFGEVPAVTVELISRPDMPPVGAGEGTQGPVSAAIGNALYHALGVRLRDLPFTRERVIAAMSS